MIPAGQVAGPGAAPTPARADAPTDVDDAVARVGGALEDAVPISAFRKSLPRLPEAGFPQSGIFGSTPVRRAREPGYDRIFDRFMSAVRVVITRKDHILAISELAQKHSNGDPDLFAHLVADALIGLGYTLRKDCNRTFTKFATISERYFTNKDQYTMAMFRLAEQLGVSLEVASREIMKKADKDDYNKGSSAYLCLLMGAYDEGYVSNLKRVNPHVFKTLLAVSDTFFTNICVHHPEWIIEEEELVRSTLFCTDGDFSQLSRLMARPELYARLPRELKERFALDAVSTDGMVLDDVPQEFWTEELLEAAIRQNPNCIKYIAASDIENKDRYYKLACSIDGLVLRHIPLHERSGEIAVVAMKENDDAVIFTEPAMMYPEDYMEEARRAIDNNSCLYGDLSAEAWLTDETIIRSAIRFEDNIPLVLQNTNLSKDIVLEIVSGNGMYLTYVQNEDFKKDHAVIEAALTSNPYAIHYVHPSERYNPKWYGLLRKDPGTAYLTELPRSIQASSLRLSHEQLDEIMLNRQRLENLVMHNPENPRRPDKPIALFIYPTSDHNGAFRLHAIQEAIDAGYQVVYYEATSEDELLRIINFYLPLLQEGDFVQLAGHGTRDSLNLSREDPGNPHSAPRYQNWISESYDYDFEFILELYDEQLLTEYIPESRIKPGVIFHLNSCANAEGGIDNPDNMMNMFDRIFRDRWHIYAVDVPGMILPEFDDGELYSFDAFPTEDRKRPQTTLYHLLPDSEEHETIIYSEVDGFWDSLLYSLGIIY